MKKTAFKNGYTLVELLITCGIFLVVLGVLSFILVNNVRYLKKGEAETEQVKSLRSSLYYMVKTLTESDRIYNYNDPNWSTNAGAAGGTSQIVFNYRGKVCTFAYNSQLKEIEYFEYSGYPTANNILPARKGKLLASRGMIAFGPWAKPTPTPTPTPTPAPTQTNNPFKPTPPPVPVPTVIPTPIPAQTGSPEAPPPALPPPSAPPAPSGATPATPYPARLTVTPDSRRPISLRVGSIRGVVFKIEDPANPKMITIEETANPAFAGGQVFTLRVKVLMR